MKKYLLMLVMTIMLFILTGCATPPWSDDEVTQMKHDINNPVSRDRDSDNENRCVPLGKIEF